MSYKLFLDDERDPYKVTWVKLPLGPWVIVRSYKEFVAAIEERGLPAFVTFDHDLAFEHYPFGENRPGMKFPYDTYKEKTGYHAAQYLFNYCIERDLPLPEIKVHSMNVTGKANIIALFQSYDRVKEHLKS